MTKGTCAACRHRIDESARVCPYCGADPATGQKLVDTQAIMQEVFKPRTVTTSESVIDYARQRQGVVIGVGIAVVFLILAGLHQFVTARNQSSVTATPAVALTDVTDLSNQPQETKPQPMPELKFQYDGNPKAMQTFIVEPGAIAPAPPPAPVVEPALSPATTSAAPPPPAPTTTQ